MEEKSGNPQSGEGNINKPEVCAKCGKPFKGSRRDIDILTGEVFHPECVTIG